MPMLPYTMGGAARGVRGVVDTSSIFNELSGADNVGVRGTS